MSDRQIVVLPISGITPYHNNPRKNDDAVQYVARSIREYGFKQPIVVDKNQVIIAGHTRWKAAQLLGLTEVPVIVADDLSEDQAKQYRLADNKVAELAVWDFSALEEELGAIDFDMSQFGFDAPEDFDSDAAISDDYEEGESIPQRASTGDIFVLGRHRLMCGDSTSKEDVQMLMGGEIADLFLTDPPYNVDYTGKTKEALKIQNDKVSDEQFSEFLFDAFSAADGVLKKGGVFYIWHSDTYGLFFRKACLDLGWKLRECLIWCKNAMVLGRQDYQWRHEPCLYGWKDGGSHYWGSDRSQTTILEFDKPLANKEHPTMKPIELFGYQIKNSSRLNENVLDLFGGSGTTIIACEQIDRSCYTMELDPHYCDVIIHRWETLTGQKAKKVES